MLPDCPEAHVRKNAVQFNQLYRDSINTRTIFPETKDVVMALFRKGYRLGLVSNTTSSVEVPEALSALHISGCFETVILSAVLGKRKPDPSILLEATRRMDVNPEKCAYVGDRAERDVAAARRAGFGKTIIISDPAIQANTTDPALIPDHFIQNLSDLPALLPPLEKKHAKPKYNATFSTMWGIKSTPTLTDFFDCSQRLGFAAVELNHMINSDMLQGFNPNGYTISSIHEPCPADVSAEKLKQLDHLISSTNEEYRRIGIESIKRSIDMAKHYGSKVVVIHSGHVDPSKQLENRMRAMVASGNSHTTEYCDLKEKLIRFRAEQAPPHFESVIKSIRELLDYAKPHNIKLGIEVRYHYLEIPSPDELEVLLSLASPDQIGFIYDVGHAQTLDRLGFYPHEEWLKRFSTRIIETHIHDVIGTTDHLAPGLGEVDFDMVARYLPAQAIRTCEFQDVNTYEQVKSALSFLAAKGCISKPQ